MQPLRRESIGQFLGTRPVVDAHEGVIRHGEVDTAPRQPPRQPVVAIAVELKAKRALSGHPEIDQSERGIHEVEIIVQ